MREPSFEDNSVLRPYLHWEGWKWPSLRLDSSMVEVALPYIEAGFANIMEIDQSDSQQISKLHPLVKFVLRCLGYGPNMPRH